MASTPPAQIRTEIRTPPTPLHGSAYRSTPSPSRYDTRSSKKTPGSSSSLTQSPRSPRPSTSLQPHSQVTPKRKSRRIQVLSPTSPDSDTTSHPPSNRPAKPSYLSAAAVVSEGMLPTPIKTPQKKLPAKSTIAGRALFQDQSADMGPSPRKSKKTVRHNGFSLESFAAHDPSQDTVQIHIDSRDQIPEVDASEANPFHSQSASASKKRTGPSASHQPTRSSKRRKVNSEENEKKPLDPQVEQAIQNDEGMVYVFRGKKVYRRFEDAGDEEEVIDTEELGLLRHQLNGHDVVKPLKTLTRKSIKPRRLFQDALPPASASDEEAETEIEEDQVENQADEGQPSPSRARRSRTRDVANGAEKKSKSPFDSWRRLKPGSGSASGPASASRSRKRTAAEALDV